MNTETAKGFKRGLQSLNAKPASMYYYKVTAAIDRMDHEHGLRLSQGGNADKLRELAKEKIGILKQEARRANMQMAQDRAKEYADIQSKFETKYANPMQKMADITEASLLISTMDKGAVMAFADAVQNGVKHPSNPYMILEATKHLGPKHELKKRVSEGIDYASFTKEGQQAQKDMLFYAQLGDNLAYKAEDGTLIKTKIEDLYDPRPITAKEQAALELNAVV